MHEGHPPKPDPANPNPVTLPDKRGWLGSIFGKGDDVAAPVESVAAPAAGFGAVPTPDLFERIGGFLKANRLDPTPVNYDLAYQFFCSDDPELTAAIDAAIAQDGILRPHIAQDIANAAANQVSAELLEKLIQTAHQSMTVAAGLVVKSTADAKAYGSALEKGAVAFDSGAEPAARALTLLVDLTRAMIGKNEDAERRLNEMGHQMESLKDNLAEAQSNAETDPLTGLANRRAFQAKLLEAARQALQENYPLTVAFCDIDHFKKFNDTHGHDTGDRILRLVADALAEGAGDDTFVGRYGGEEFLILFDGIMARRAAMRVDEIRDELQNRSLVSRTTGESLGTITFSAGVAQLQNGEDVGEMLKRADDALYKAKGAGRNRVIISGEE
jgi:diguanylate cyclase